jgi:hypothetical protein
MIKCICLLAGENEGVLQFALGENQSGGGLASHHLVRTWCLLMPLKLVPHDASAFLAVRSLLVRRLFSGNHCKNSQYFNCYRME